MSYHTTSAATRQSTTNARGKTAPTGYHYMPDGSLMSDVEHARLYGGRTIKDFNLDTSDIRAVGEKRPFTILGDKDAVFSLEIREGVNYYNFQTSLFQTTKTGLVNVSIEGNFYRGDIVFPRATLTTDTVNGAVTSGVKVVMDTVVASTMKVGDRVTGNTYLNDRNVTVVALNPDDDNTSEFSLSEFVAIADGVTLSFEGAHQYDIYLSAESSHGTYHAKYNEVRFIDNSIDINSTTGSNSNLVRKVIYQPQAVTITLSGYAPNNTITSIGSDSNIIITSRNASTATIPFSFDITTGTSNTLAISKQPTSGDVLALVTATPGAAPLDIEGEDIYPAVTETDVVNGEFSAGTTHKIVMDTNVVDKMVVGDRITIATGDFTDTVDGAVTTSSKVVMDNNVVTKMAAGDRITIVGNTLEEMLEGQEFLDKNVVIVEELNPDGDNHKEFSMSEAIPRGISDGTTLTFTSKLNREVITVAALNPDTDNAKEFSMKDTNGNNVNVGILDNTTLSFSNQRNYRWSFDNIYNLTPGMRQLASTYFTSQPTIKEYLTQTTINEGEPGEYKIDNVRIPALEPAGTATTPSTPVTTRDSTTKVETITQTGNVTFSEQAKLTFGGGANATIFSYGTPAINRLTGYDVEFTDLTVELTPISTTTTAASSNSKSVVIADRIGISDGISTVSGIGINPTISGTDTVNGTFDKSTRVIVSGDPAESAIKPGDVITGDGIPLTSTVTVVALNPDGDNTAEISVSEEVTVANGVTLSFSHQANTSPTVISGAGTATGPGTIVLSAPQTLENGVTLTFPGAGSIATITGNIKVNKVGNEDVVLRFDVEKFLTMQ